MNAAQQQALAQAQAATAAANAATAGAQAAAAAANVQTAASAAPLAAAHASENAVFEANKNLRARQTEVVQGVTANGPQIRVIQPRPQQAPVQSAVLRFRVDPPGLGLPAAPAPPAPPPAVLAIAGMNPTFAPEGVGFNLDLVLQGVDPNLAAPQLRFGGGALIALAPNPAPPNYQAVIPAARVAVEAQVNQRIAARDAANAVLQAAEQQAVAACTPAVRAAAAATSQAADVAAAAAGAARNAQQGATAAAAALAQQIPAAQNDLAAVQAQIQAAQAERALLQARLAQPAQPVGAPPDCVDPVVLAQAAAAAAAADQQRLPALIANILADQQTEAQLAADIQTMNQAVQDANAAAAAAGAQVEPAYTAAAEAYEAADGSHAWARHGAHIPDALLDRRIFTGRTPEDLPPLIAGGPPRPNYSASDYATKFESAEVYVKSRAAMIALATNTENIDLVNGTANGIPLSGTVPTGFPKFAVAQQANVLPLQSAVVGHGKIGTGPAIPSPDAGAPATMRAANSDACHAASADVPNIPGLYTTVEYRPHMQRLCLVQHYPLTADFNVANGAYNNPLPGGHTINV